MKIELEARIEVPAVQAKPSIGRTVCVTAHVTASLGQRS